MYIKINPSTLREWRLVCFTSILFGSEEVIVILFTVLFFFNLTNVIQINRKLNNAV